MNLSKRFLTLLFTIIAIKTISNKGVLAEENNSYTITSNTQSQSADGNYEASGNVIISNETNFKGRSENLFYEKDNSKIHLKGKVKIENYESGNI